MTGVVMAAAGLGKVTVAISNQTLSQTTVDPVDARKGYKLKNTGVAVQVTGVAETEASLENWVTPTGAAGAAFEARVTVNSGLLSGGAGAGSWLTLDTDREWYVRQNSVGTQTANITVEIRDAASTTVLDSATIDLTATVDP